ncbi:hypothetical protein LTR04_005768, partial [Oleoguttula sp. CCFEE 6159]
LKLEALAKQQQLDRFDDMVVQSKISGGRVASPPVGQHGVYQMADLVHHDTSDLQSTTFGSVVDDPTSTVPPSRVQKSTNPTSTTPTLAYPTNKGKGKLMESVKSSSPVSANVGSDGSEGSIHGGGTNDDAFEFDWSGRGPEDIGGFSGMQRVSAADDSKFAGDHMKMPVHTGGVAGPSDVSFRQQLAAITDEYGLERTGAGSSQYSVYGYGPQQSTLHNRLNKRARDRLPRTGLPRGDNHQRLAFDTDGSRRFLHGSESGDVESSIPARRSGLSTARKWVVGTLLGCVGVAVGLTPLAISQEPKEYHKAIVGGSVAVTMLFIAALMVVGKFEHPVGHFTVLATLVMAAGQFVCDHLL